MDKPQTNAAISITDSDEQPRVSFTSFADGTEADWEILGAAFVRFASGLPDRVLAHLKLLADFGDGLPVDRLTHSLQVATLAHDDGRDEEYVVCALLHDIGDSLGAYNHPDIAAAILRPFVSERNLWMVEKHGIFQSYHMFRHVIDHDMRDALRSHRHFAYALEFSTRYDNPAFDPRRRTRPLSFFEPMVHRLFARPRRAS